MDHIENIRRHKPVITTELFDKMFSESSLLALQNGICHDC